MTTNPSKAAARRKRIMVYPRTRIGLIPLVLCREFWIVAQLILLGKNNSTPARVQSPNMFPILIKTKRMAFVNKLTWPKPGVTCARHVSSPHSIRRSKNGTLRPRSRPTRQTPHAHLSPQLPVVRRDISVQPHLRPLLRPHRMDRAPRHSDRHSLSRRRPCPRHRAIGLHRRGAVPLSGIRHRPDAPGGPARLPLRQDRHQRRLVSRRNSPQPF